MCVCKCAYNFKYKIIKLHRQKKINKNKQITDSSNILKHSQTLEMAHLAFILECSRVMSSYKMRACLIDFRVINNH